MEPCAGDWLRSFPPTYQGEKGSKTKAKAIILKSIFLLIYLQTKNVMYKINQ